MATRKPQPHCIEARSWLRLRHGATALGVFVGSTNRIFSAYLHLLDAWTVADNREMPFVETALAACVAAMQRSEWPLAAEAIAQAANWSDVERLWDEIRTRLMGTNMPRFVALVAGGDHRVVMVHGHSGESGY